MNLYQKATSINAHFLSLTDSDKFLIILTESTLSKALGLYIAQAWRYRQEQFYK